MSDSILNESALLKRLMQHLGSSLTMNSQLSFMLCLLLLRLKRGYCYGFWASYWLNSPVWCLFLNEVGKGCCMFERQSSGKTLKWTVSSQPVEGAGERAMSCDLITLWRTCSCCDGIKRTHARAAGEHDLGIWGQSTSTVRDWANRMI